ncbi:MAG TPA: LysR substrate-binding domain-containing protein [Variovorax sp.]
MTKLWMGSVPSVALTFGLDHVLPLLPQFLERYPNIRPDWHFENRQVDLIGEGFDAAIGGGFELVPGVVSRDLAPAHIIAVASPAYLRHKRRPKDPAGLAPFDGIVMRSERTGRVRQWMMVNAAGEQMPAAMKETIVLNDPAAMCRAARGSISLYYASRALMALKTRAFVEFVVEEFRRRRLARRLAGDAG